MRELAICTNPLAREVMPLWHLDRVLDTQGGVHDSPTSAHARRSAAAQLLRTHDPSLHPHRRLVRQVLSQVTRSAGPGARSHVSAVSAQRTEAGLGNDSRGQIGTEVPLHAHPEADLVRSRGDQAQGAPKVLLALSSKNNDKTKPPDSRGLTRSLHIRDFSAH